jgi:DNA recombination protein RmuC
MDTLSIILVIIIIVLVIAIAIFLAILNKKIAGKDDERDLVLISETLKSLKDDLKTDIRETRRELDQKIYSGQRDMSENVKYQFEASQKLIRDINEHLGKVNESVVEVKEGSKQVVSMTEQLSNLEKVLTNQKQRGNWGESSLELILSNYLAGQYEMQYRFKNGEIVDAVITMKGKYLPIDSKFSIDNYRRCLDATNDEDRKYFADEFKKDIKKRIEETSKYVNEVDENTTPFAFMFIPSEAIYYDINAGSNGSLKVDTEKLLDFAKSKRVHLVSPSSIFAFIHLIWSVIKYKKIEEGAR